MSEKKGKKKSRVEKSPEKKPENEVEKKKPRKKLTFEENVINHVENYDALLKLLDSEIDRKSREKERGVRNLRKIRKRVIKMRKEVPGITRSKFARKYTSTRKRSAQSGFEKKCDITPALAKFLKVKKDVQLSRTEVMNAICVYIRLKDDETRDRMLKWEYLNPKGKRNLQNGMQINPDEKLSDILNYKKYRKDVRRGKVIKKVKNKETGEKEEVVEDDDKLYYYVIQKLITPHLIKCVVPPPAETKDL